MGWNRSSDRRGGRGTTGGQESRSPAKHANALTPRRDRSHVRPARRIDGVNVDVVLVRGHVGEDGHVVALARPGVPVGVSGV